MFWNPYDTQESQSINKIIAMFEQKWKNSKPCHDHSQNQELLPKQVLTNITKYS